MIRKIIAVLVVFVISLSCSTEEEVRNEYYLLPTSSVELPEVFEVNQDNTITLRYIRPTTCYLFSKVYVAAKPNNEIEFAVQVIKLHETNCADATSEGEYEVHYNFETSVSGTYTLKFLNEEGNYTEHVVQVN
ncbi:hypothetical protein [Flavobacterium sp.]|uniref:hypothetical protein n=1 Tax=Flavobacterium sp. TaxID=239 RepID=UPI003528D1FE